MTSRTNNPPFPEHHIVLYHYELLHDMNQYAQRKMRRFQELLTDLRSDTTHLWDAYYDGAIELDS